MVLHAASNERTRDNRSMETPQTYYTSNVLRLFMEGLDHLENPLILDLGPVCSENITFFAQRLKRIHLCDMFLRTALDQRKKRPSSQTWRFLDYADESFEGILLWDLADRLEDPEVKELIKRCYTMLKPRGKMVVFVLGDQVALPGVNSFVIGNDYRVHLRPQPHLNLPLKGRQNRDVLSLLKPFTPVKSFIYRNGLIEFLFQRS